MVSSWIPNSERRSCKFEGLNPFLSLCHYLSVPVAPLWGIGHQQTVFTLHRPVPHGWHHSKSYFLFLIPVHMIFSSWSLVFLAVVHLGSSQLCLPGCALWLFSQRVANPSLFLFSHLLLHLILVQAFPQAFVADDVRPFSINYHDIKCILWVTTKTWYKCVWCSISVSIIVPSFVCIFPRLSSWNWGA